MAKIDVLQYVKEYLLPDEEVIETLIISGAISKVYYATNKRLISLKPGESSEDLTWTFALGAVGRIAFASRHREYYGDIEYSRISDTALNKYHPKGQIILGFLLGLPLISIGVWLLTIIPGPPVFQGMLILVGLLLILALSCRGKSYYLLRVHGLSEEEENIWRIDRPRGGEKKVDNFVEIVKEKAGICPH
jgi:hypothetical protein